MRTVIFDAGMTLIRAQPSYADVFAAGCTRAGVELSLSDDTDLGPTMDAVWRRHTASWREAGNPSPHVGDDRAERGFWTGLYRQILHALEIEGDHDAIARDVYDTFLESESFGPFDDVAPTIENLDARGVRLGLLSNWGRWLRRLLGDHGLAHHFDVIVISGEEAVAKPDPEIFRRTLARMGEDAGPHVAYVGDDVEHDIAPALELGLRAVLVDRLGRYAGDEPVAGAVVIEDLTELPDVLEIAGNGTSPR